jgi:hypothetical protein
VQVKVSYLRIFVAVVMTTLVISACAGGGNPGSTWFNLPSIPITVDQNGNGTALGFPIGYLGLHPTMIGQLQEAGIQQLEVRVGNNGVFILANGEALPYVAWNDASVETLQTVLRTSRDVPNGDTIASALPWLRRIGTGARIHLPIQGAARNIPRWTGEVLMTPPRNVQTTIGPIQVGALAFDQQGNATVAGVPLADFGAGFTLPPNVQQLVNSLQMQQATVAIKPGGLNLSYNNRPLPSLVYDQQRLTRALNVAGPFVGDPGMVQMLNEAAPQIVGADVVLVVSFTGEPAGPTQISAIPLRVAEDGSINAYGIPLGANLPPEMVQALAESETDQLYVSLSGNSLRLAMNEQPLPVIAWSDEGLGLLGAAGDTFGISPAMISGGLRVLNNLTAETPIALTLSMPTAADATAVPDVDFSGLIAPETVDVSSPDIQMGAALANGRIQSVAGLPASTLEQLGVALPELPADIVSLLASLNASQLQIANTDNALLIIADNVTLLSLSYTEDSLNRMVVLVGSLTGDAELAGTVGGFLPFLTEQDLNIVVTLDGSEPPATQLAAIPVNIQADGGLTVYGIDLGLGEVLPADMIAQLQEANIQRLDLDIQDNSLYLAANGQPLPIITWSEPGLALIQQLAGSMMDMSPEVVGTLLNLLDTVDVGLHVTLPAAEGVAMIELPADYDVTQVNLVEPEVDDATQVIVQAVLVFEGSELRQVGNVPAETIREMGISIPDLPADIAQLLRDELGITQIRLVTLPNGLELSADNQIMLAIRYDQATIQNALVVAGPFLPENIAGFLDDPDAMLVLQQSILPLVAGADVNITAELQ